MPPLPNKESLIWFGLLAIFIIGTAVTTMIQEFVKEKIRNKNGFDRRKGDEQMFERFMSAMLAQGENSIKVAEELRNVGGTLSDVSRSLKDKLERIIDENGEIVERIEELDVPRKRHR